MSLFFCYNIFCQFFSSRKNVILDWNFLKELQWGWEEIMTAKKNERNQTLHHVCATVFHRQHLWTHPPPPPPIWTAYISRLCAMLEARLDVARPCTLRGVLLCYRVQCVTKTKSAQTFRRLNEILKCEACVMCWCSYLLQDQTSGYVYLSVCDVQWISGV